MHSRDSSEGQFEANPEYPSYEAGLEEQETEAYHLYRYAGKGLIVYDSKARYSDSDSRCVQMSLPPRAIPEEVRKDLDRSSDYGSSYSDREKYLHSPLYPPCKYINEQYTLVVPSYAVRFDSKFESGNLASAVMLGEEEYELSLEYDLGTKGFTQWFYFSAVCNKSNSRVRLSIVNLMKYESLYNSGLKPVVKAGNRDWARAGTEVTYFQNNTVRANPNKDPKIPTHFYTLTFTYVFERAGETVYFAHCYPYTYSDLQSYLRGLQADSGNSDRLRVDVLCKSQYGNDCPVVTITEEIETYPAWREEEAAMPKSCAGRKLLRLRMSRLSSSGKHPAS